MKEPLDPKEFIITRKRKKYKFAKFHNAQNCFEFDEWTKRTIDTIELGAGTGLFSVELAAKYPDKQFLAVDVKADRLQKGAYAAQERGITNVTFLRARADQLLGVVDPHSLKQVWVTFPDPFPKKRSSGRRLTHARYLNLYRDALRPNGSFCLKHDNPAFFQWSLEQLVQEGWRIQELFFDLHAAEYSDDASILTTYEERWLDEGRTTSYVRATV